MPLSSDIPAVAGTIESTANLEGLFRAHYSRLACVLYRVVGDTGVSEELAAEAFWKLQRNPPPSNSNFTGWLYRAGLRLALDHLRRRKRRAHYESLAPQPTEALNPAEALERSERALRVRETLAKLKPEQASLLVLRSEGYSLAEIASLQFINPNSVGTFLARAEAAFRKEYVHRYGED